MKRKHQPSLQLDFTATTQKPKKPLKLNQSTTILFASAEQGRVVITKRDDYIQSLSAFDLVSRMQVNHPVSEAEHVDFLGEHTRDWDDQARRKITVAVKKFIAATKHLSLTWPEEILLVKTSGEEEGGAAFTRSNAIFLSQCHIDNPRLDEIDQLVFHEFFHVLTRQNPDLQNRLYNAIGFEKCNDIVFPPSLAHRKISNPDAPRNDHFIRVQHDGRDYMAVPILFSREEQYDCEKAASFFAYMEFQLLAVTYENGIDGTVVPLCNGTEPVLLAPDEVTGFFEKIGRNTDYIIHPEEVLADNFVHVLQQTKDLPTPEIPQKMLALLPAAKAGVKKPCPQTPSPSL